MTELSLSRYKLSSLNFSSLILSQFALTFSIWVTQFTSSLWTNVCVRVCAYMCTCTHVCVPVLLLCVLPSTVWSHPQLGQSSSPARPASPLLPPARRETADDSPRHKYTHQDMRLWTFLTLLARIYVFYVCILLGIHTQVGCLLWAGFNRGCLVIKKGRNTQRR